MAEARVGIKVADDRQTVTIEIGAVGGGSSPVELSLEQLTAEIRLLGQARSRMVEGSTKQPLDGKTVETVIDPPWYIQVASIDGSLLLSTISLMDLSHSRFQGVMSRKLFRS
jgi:hypothetical protein